LHEKILPNQLKFKSGIIFFNKRKKTIESRRIDLDVDFSWLAREVLGDEVTQARVARVILGDKDGMDTVRSTARTEVSAVDVVARLFLWLNPQLK
jgi:hypothetical protein